MQEGGREGENGRDKDDVIGVPIFRGIRGEASPLDF